MGRADFRVHTIGCGSARPTLRHQPSCTVVEHNSNLYMVDCGEGAQQGLARQELKMSRLAHVFLTHLHGDHVFGLFGLLGTMALKDLRGHITIHTFEEGREILDYNFRYFNRDTPFDIHYNILDPHKEEIALETPTLRVRTVPLRHRVDCVGYVFEEQGKLRHIRRDMCDFHGVPHYFMNTLRQGADFVKDDGTVVPNELLTSPADKALSYAHLGDTSSFPELARMAGPVDLMYHETTYLDANEADAAKRGHSTARQAAICAREAGAGALLTGHYSSRYKDEHQFLVEAREEFPNVILNREGLTTEVRSVE